MCYRRNSLSSLSLYFCSLSLFSPFAFCLFFYFVFFLFIFPLSFLFSILCSSQIVCSCRLIYIYFPYHLLLFVIFYHQLVLDSRFCLFRYLVFLSILLLSPIHVFNMTRFSNLKHSTFNNL